jgi:hypothetical protein
MKVIFLFFSNFFSRQNRGDGENPRLETKMGVYTPINEPNTNYNYEM